jgi:hypothetical protein
MTPPFVFSMTGTMLFLCRVDRIFLLQRHRLSAAHQLPYARMQKFDNVAAYVAFVDLLYFVMIPSPLLIFYFGMAGKTMSV